MEPLIKILKEIFCKFDKNEIHKERTFIFQLRSPEGSHDDFYIINYEDELLRKYDDDDESVKTMFLTPIEEDEDEEDKRKHSYYYIVSDYCLYHRGKEHKL